MKMTANEVIESYITDVAQALPRKQRNDVAFELRALISEGLQDKAEEAGRTVDAEMAVEFMRAFGRPEDVAARYRPTLNVIDPADGQRFLRATFIGLAIIWGVGFVALLQNISELGLLNAIMKWWFGTMIASLWWPGVLVAGFGISAWVHRRWPQTSEWKPRAAHRIEGGRTGMVMGLIAMMCGVLILIEPRWVLDFFWDGKAAPVAYQALTYTDTFLHRQAPWILGLLLLNIPLFIATIIKGRHTMMLQGLETVFGLITCAVLIWTVMDGPIFMAQASDQTAKFILVMIVLFSLLTMAIVMYRKVRPKPDQQIQMQ